MDHLFVHSRVLTHLNRFSLDAPRRFYLVLNPFEGRSKSQTKTLTRASSAFGCAGMLIVGESESEEKDDDSGVPTMYVKTLQEALTMAKTSLHSETVAVVITSDPASIPVRSIPLSHPKAFPRIATFVFIHPEWPQDLCHFDHVVHITPNLVKQPHMTENEACIAVTLHRFLQTRSGQAQIK